MAVRQMNLEELRHALEWAAKEGWNPGVDDVAPFYVADPDGFFVNEVDGEMAAVISVVNHSPAFAFLGLYICHPRFRGRGFGVQVWNAALQHAGNRTIGLDGVPDQQENYRKSSFVYAGKTTRYQGRMPVCSGKGSAPVDVSTLIMRDAETCGFERPRYSAAWFADTEARKTIALPPTGQGLSFLTVRECNEGLKIGPILAHSASEVASLLLACPTKFSSKSVMIDVPETSPALAEYLTGSGFAPIFETARMYKGKPPSGDPPKFYSTATLELG